MLKKHFHTILLLLTTLGITSLQAAQQDQGKNEAQATAIAPSPSVGYYDYTLKNSNREINNTVYPDELEDQKKYLKDKYIAGTLQNKKGVIFFMLIVSNTQTNVRSKFFFFNAAPKLERDAIKRVQNLLHCHTITHTQVNLSPHIIFQVLGWLEQTQSKYIPLFIHASAPVCETCDAIIANLFHLRLLSNTKGCNGANSIDLAGTYPLAQQYIKKNLTLPLAKKLLWPTLRLTYGHSKLKQNSVLLQNTEKKASKLLLAKNNHIEALKRLLKDRIALPCSPLKGHIGCVQHAIVTSDHRYIVSGSKDHTIRIWDFQTGKEVSYSPLQGHSDAVTCVAVTSDNQYIVSGSMDYTIRIWELKTGKELPYRPLTSDGCEIYSVKITKDNKYIVSVSRDKTIHIWDFKTGKEVCSPLKGHTHYVWSIAITKHNKYIVSGSWDKTIRIWDFKTGKEVKYSPLKSHSKTVWSVAVSHDRKYIVSGSEDNTIRVWDFKTGKQLPYSPLTGHTSWVNSVAITKGNKYIISGSCDRTIRIWDFKTGKELPYSPLKGHTGDIRSVEITKYNQFIVSAGTDSTIRIWDLKLLNALIKEEKRAQGERIEANKVFDID